MLDLGRVVDQMIGQREHPSGDRHGPGVDEPPGQGDDQEHRGQPAEQREQPARGQDVERQAEDHPFDDQEARRRELVLAEDVPEVEDRHADQVLEQGLLIHVQLAEAGELPDPQRQADADGQPGQPFAEASFRRLDCRIGARSHHDPGTPAENWTLSGDARPVIVLCCAPGSMSLGDLAISKEPKGTDDGDVFREKGHGAGRRQRFQHRLGDQPQAARRRRGGRLHPPARREDGTARAEAGRAGRRQADHPLRRPEGRGPRPRLRRGQARPTARSISCSTRSPSPRSTDLKCAFVDCSREGFKTAMDISVYSLAAVARHAAPVMTEGARSSRSPTSAARRSSPATT